MKKSGFTIVEVVVSLLIIGVLTVITLKVTNRSANQYAKLYYAAYDSLVQAVGNAYLDWKPIENPVRGRDPDAAFCLEDGEEYYWSKHCWKLYTATITESEGLKKCANNYITGTVCSKPGNWYYDYLNKAGTYQHVVIKDENGNTDESIYYGGIKGYPRRYPGFLMGKAHDKADYMGGRYDGWGTDTAFCKDISKYYNTLSTKNDCMSFMNGINDKGGINPEVAGGFHRVFCAAIPPEGTSEPTGACFDTRDNTLMPSFIAANGQKFYISSLVTANAPFLCPDADDACKKQRRYFRFIAVDLNGDSGPNRQFAKGAKFPWITSLNNTNPDTGSYPDIVLFAITDSGEVIPLGLPEFSTAYATAKVYYPEYLNETEVVDGITQFKRNDADTSTTMSLYNAKLTAWGDNAANSPNLVCEQPVMEKAPITYSELFYWIALNCGKDGCNGTTDYDICKSPTSKETTPLYADKNMANIVRQFIFKDEGPIMKKNDKVDKNYVIYGPESRNRTFIPQISSMSLLDTQHGCMTSTTKCKVQIEYDTK